MQTVKTDAVITVPPEVAKCPICGAEVVLEIDSWQQEDDGTWSAEESGVHVDCVREPDDIESDEWEDFDRSHWSMPYVNWLPIQGKVYRWLLQNYRFDLEHA